MSEAPTSKCQRIRDEDIVLKRQSNLAKDFTLEIIHDAFVEAWHRKTDMYVKNFDVPGTLSGQILRLRPNVVELSGRTEDGKPVFPRYLLCPELEFFGGAISDLKQVLVQLADAVIFFTPRESSTEISAYETSSSNRVKKSFSAIWSLSMAVSSAPKSRMLSSKAFPTIHRTYLTLKNSTSFASVRQLLNLL
ncbi:hypothetical protein D9757_006598 [Collybiopsis confluens]|uniref:Uncharacterized protein n=1 Tax=Collybiopsis confluens TaxID=2823264 RepID=A0A8H5HQC8_9AGAR|nr:hypothetical protein D9757_006598 [Collybiopsis confluens]